MSETDLEKSLCLQVQRWKASTDVALDKKEKDKDKDKDRDKEKSKSKKDHKTKKDKKQKKDKEASDDQDDEDNDLIEGEPIRKRTRISKKGS